MRVGLLLVAAGLFAVAGCGQGTADGLLVESSTSEVRFPGDEVMTIAASALDQLDLDGGTVIVPTDRAVFAQDADALADLLAGDVTDLIAESVISIDYGLAIEDWPGQIGDGTRPTLEVGRTDDGWSVGGHPVVDVWRREGVTVVVIDGILDR